MEAIELEGYAGYLDGETNPYEPGSPENEAWNRGYWEAAKLEAA